jgi:hypothetical protein
VYSDFADAITCSGDWSYSNCCSTMIECGSTDLSALGLLHLIEISRRIRLLCIYETGNEPSPCDWSRIFAYLAIHTQDLSQVIFDGSTNIETVLEAMNRFPNLTSINWRQDEYDNLTGALIELMKLSTFPNIKSFDIISDSSIDPQVTSAVILACPNLTTLTCHAGNSSPWVKDGLKDVLRNCSKLCHLDISCSTLLANDIGPIFPFTAIAEHCSMLTSLKLAHWSSSYKLDLRVEAIAIALRAIIRRLNILILYLDFDCLPSNISGLFEPSADIDLHKLTIKTYNEDADMIAKILKGCRNANELHFSGEASISPVLMKISDSCHQLVTLALYKYKGVVDGPAIRGLLQSNPQLESLTLDSTLDLLAYESLALYGDSLMDLCLCSSDSTIKADSNGNIVQSFLSNSAVFDANSKQTRQKTMKTFRYEMSSFLSIESLAAFLSCFGMIKSLEIDLSYSLAPTYITGISNTDLCNFPIFHVENLILTIDDQAEEGEEGFSDSYDRMFLELMAACRSLKTLFLKTNVLQASSLIILAYMCHHRQEPLSMINCPKSLNLQELQHLMPSIRLRSY